MSLEVTGKLVFKGDTQQVSEKFKKREFVLEISEEINGNLYNNYGKFQLTQAKCEILDRYREGETIAVKFNIKGNRWERDGKVNYITNLDAWRIDGANNQQQAAPQYSNQQQQGGGYQATPVQHQQPPAANFNVNPETINDLPF